MHHSLANAISEADFKTLAGNLNRGLEKHGIRVGHARMSEVLAQAMGFSHAAAAKTSLKSSKSADLSGSDENTIRFRLEDMFADPQAGQLPEQFSEPEFSLTLARGKKEGTISQITIRERRATSREITVEMNCGMLKTVQKLPVSTEPDLVTMSNGEFLFVERASEEPYDRLRTLRFQRDEEVDPVMDLDTLFDAHSLDLKQIWALEGCVLRELDDARARLSAEFAKKEAVENKEALLASATRAMTAIDYAGFMAKNIFTDDIVEICLITKILMICDRPELYGRIPGHWFKGVDRAGNARSVFMPLLLAKHGHFLDEAADHLWGVTIDRDDIEEFEFRDYPFTFACNPQEPFSLRYDYLKWL